MMTNKITKTTAEQFMRRAFELALKGQGMTSPNPIVGAVVVKNGCIVGEGWHRRCGGPHAEVYALRQAGQAAQGATLYVTLEPCHHVGRTPPCVDAVLKSGIREVVIGMKDPNPLTNGQSIHKLRRANVRVRVGILEKELAAVNAPFVKFIQTGLPYVVAKMAVTLDGKIATRTGHSQWITSEAARRFARRQRNAFDAIVVGINTVLRDDPLLSLQRRKNVWRKVILDSHLRMPPSARLLTVGRPQECLIATTARASARKVTLLRKLGAEVLVLPGQDGRVDLKKLLAELARRGMIHVLLEGGAAVVGSGLQEQLVDRLHVYIAPKIVGDQQAHSAVTGLNILDVNQALRLNDPHMQMLGEDIFIDGEVYYPHGKNRKKE